MRALAASLGIGALVLGGCGGSHKSSACPAAPGRSVVTPLTGRLVVQGRPPVEVRIDNRGDLRHGVAVLAATDYAGWYALKSHFMTPPAYRGDFTVRVRALDGSGAVRIGGAPTGTTYAGGQSPFRCSRRLARLRPRMDGGRGPGCYAWDVSGAASGNRFVVRATANH